MIAALEGGEWSAARPGRTLPPGKTRYPFCRRLGGPHGHSGRAENLVPTGIRSRTVQPVLSFYTDWALYMCMHICIYIYMYQKKKIIIYRPKYVRNAKTGTLMPVPYSLYLKSQHWMSIPVNTSRCHMYHFCPQQVELHRIQRPERFTNPGYIRNPSNVLYFGRHMDLPAELEHYFKPFERNCVQSGIETTIMHSFWQFNQLQGMKAQRESRGRALLFL